MCNKCKTLHKIYKKNTHLRLYLLVCASFIHAAIVSKFLSLANNAHHSCSHSHSHSHSHAHSQSSHTALALPFAPSSPSAISPRPPTICSQAKSSCNAGHSSTKFQISVLRLMRVRNSPCESATARIISRSSSRDSAPIFGKRATFVKSFTIKRKA